MLARNPNLPVVVFAVWEPILPTDWSKPGSSVLSRLSDTRARQIWDSSHFVAIAMKKTDGTAKAHPECCERGGFLWDLGAVYPPGTEWGDVPPEPVFIDGPVVNVVEKLEAAIRRAK